MYDILILQDAIVSVSPKSDRKYSYITLSNGTTHYINMPYDKLVEVLDPPILVQMVEDVLEKEKLKP